LDADENVTRVVQIGENTLGICLVVLGLIGGLYNSIASVFLAIVTILTSVGLISSITENLFFYSKDFTDEQLPSDRCARNYMEKTEPLNSKEKENLV